MKRHASLASLSRDHHHALVFAQSVKHDAPERLREGLPRDEERLVEVVRERFARELEPHFAVEERVLVPRCRSHGGELGAQADCILQQHEAIRAHVADLAAGSDLRDQLDAFGRALDEHVRFEERSWFPTLERELGDDALSAVANNLRPLPVARIERFDQDDEGAWIARLDCGHAQHVRHDPPWQTRAWVTSEQGRRDHVGSYLPCSWCRMPTLPPNAEEYRRTDVFDETTTPAGLLRSHRLKERAWGEIVVTEGRVLYVLEDDNDLGFVLTPERRGIVAPTRAHHVKPQPGSRFYVRFLREHAR